MGTLKYFLTDAVKPKETVHQLYFIGAFLQEKVKNKVFVNFECRYADHFPLYSSYFGRALRLLKYMYGMTNSRKLFADELTEWFIEQGFIRSQCQMSIYYKCALDGTNIVVLYYVDDCVYWYTSKDLGKWLVETIENKVHVKFLGYSNWFMSIRIS